MLGIPRSLASIIDTRGDDDMHEKTVGDGLGEPLIGKEEEEGLVHPKPERKLSRLATAFNLVVICLLPVMYLLGRSHGGEKFPLLSTHGNVARCSSCRSKY